MQPLIWSLSSSQDSKKGAINAMRYDRIKLTFFGVSLFNNVCVIKFLHSIMILLKLQFVLLGLYRLKKLYYWASISNHP